MAHLNAHLLVPLEYRFVMPVPAGLVWTEFVCQSTSLLMCAIIAKGIHLLLSLTCGNINYQSYLSPKCHDTNHADVCCNTVSDIR